MLSIKGDGMALFSAAISLTEERHRGEKLFSWSPLAGFNCAIDDVCYFLHTFTYIRVVNRRFIGWLHLIDDYKWI